MEKDRCQKGTKGYMLQVPPVQLTYKFLCCQIADNEDNYWQDESKQISVHRWSFQTSTLLFICSCGNFKYMPLDRFFIIDAQFGGYQDNIPPDNIPRTISPQDKAPPPPPPRTKSPRSNIPSDNIPPMISLVKHLLVNFFF